VCGGHDARGTLEGPHPQCHLRKELAYHCDMLRGSLRWQALVGPLVLHMLLGPQKPGSWARGIMPGVSSAFCMLAWCRAMASLSSPPTSAPDTHTCCLAASQGLHRFPGLCSLGTGRGQSWQLLPGPSDASDGEGGKGQGRFSAQPSLLGIQNSSMHLFSMVVRGQKVLSWLLAPWGSFLILGV
jgi:hypothetical protein